MTNLVRKEWNGFLEDKMSMLTEEWITEFDDSLVGMGNGYELSEDDINELAERLQTLEVPVMSLQIM